MKKILIASSSKLFLKRNTDLLTGRGLGLFSTTRGEEALKLHEEFPVNLILSDVLLEDMDGCKLCSLVNKEKKLRHVPVILCCHDHHESIEKIKQSRARALLVKPIDPILLLETVSRLFDAQIGRSKRATLKVKVLSKISNLEFICLSHDISNTGILLETNNILDLGDQIICQFKLPSSCQVETVGEVIRSVSTLDRKTYYGIKFINLSLSQLKAIDEYVDLQSHPLPMTRGRNYPVKQAI